MNEMKKHALDLLKQVEEDKYKEYDDAWKSDAVSTLNEWYMEVGREDDEIYELTSDIFEDIVKYNLESRGWLGVKCFLEDVENTADYGRIDAYGNGKSCDYELVDDLKEMVEEIERESE